MARESPRVAILAVMLLFVAQVCVAHLCLVEPRQRGEYLEQDVVDYPATSNACKRNENLAPLQVADSPNGRWPRSAG